MKKIHTKKGFTLIELLIAMAIFVTFTGVLISSYTSIVKGQRDANDYRVLAVEARHVFETLNQELRDGMVDYGENCDIPMNGSEEKITLVSKDGIRKTRITFDAPSEDIDGELELGEIKIERGELGVGSVIGVDMPIWEDPLVLNGSGVSVDEFNIYVSPAGDPYDQAHVFKDGYQFHPKVTIYAVFSKELASRKIATFDLQTSISSRIYNQIYPTSCSQ